jgi:hypothetical protein
MMGGGAPARFTRGGRGDGTSPLDEQVAVRADDYSLELQIPAALRRAFGVNA